MLLNEKYEGLLNSIDKSFFYSNQMKFDSKYNALLMHNTKVEIEKFNTKETHSFTYIVEKYLNETPNVKFIIIMARNQQLALITKDDGVASMIYGRHASLSSGEYVISYSSAGEVALGKEVQPWLDGVATYERTVSVQRAKTLLSRVVKGFYNHYYKKYKEELGFGEDEELTSAQKAQLKARAGGLTWKTLIVKTDDSERINLRKERSLAKDNMEIKPSDNKRDDVNYDRYIGQLKDKFKERAKDYLISRSPVVTSDEEMKNIFKDNRMYRYIIIKDKNNQTTKVFRLHYQDFETGIHRSGNKGVGIIRVSYDQKNGNDEFYVFYTLNIKGEFKWVGYSFSASHYDIFNSHRMEFESKNRRYFELLNRA